MFVKLRWEKFDNIFELRKAHDKTTQMVYVIGKQPYCYIGSIGSRGGKQGFGLRYQNQYLQRAKAIFGLGEKDAAPTWCGIPQNPISANELYLAEAFIQNEFQAFHDSHGNLHRPIKFPRNSIHIKNDGDLPDFLQ